MKTRLGVALLATLGTGLIATPAQAASIGVVSLAAGDDTIRYTAAAKTANKVVVTRSGRTVTIDDRVRLKAGKGCKAVKGDSTKVRCTFAIPDWNNYEILARLGDRADSLVAKGKIRVVAYGGSGADSLSGGSGDDHLIPDFTETESGDDGPDVIDPIAADVVRGGSGTDTVDYSDRQRNPVVVDLDGQAGDDGRAGEGDTVGADVENLLGTIYADTLTGNDSANEIRGSGGNDVLAGLGGADRLFGAEGDDDLSGQDTTGDQADHLDGGSQYTAAGDLCRAFPLDVVVGCER